MQVSNNGLALIREFEGCELHVYNDSRGLPTIGIGHKLIAGEAYPDGISEAKAMDLLRADVAWAVHVVNVEVRVPLTQMQFDGLTSFVYNCGSGTFDHSSVLRLLNSGHIDKAAQLMLLYCHAKGKIVDGLLRRRKAEAALLCEAEVS